MKRVLLTFAALAIALAATGCAQFEQALSTAGPSGVPSVASLHGTWTSSASIGAAASSCTNIQWKLTGQSGSAVSGEFSAVCGAYPVSGTVSGQMNGQDVPYQIAGWALLPTGNCPYSISGTAHIEDNNTIRVPYSGSTCFGPLQGEEVLRRPVQPAPAPAPAPSPTPVPAPEPPAPAVNPFHIAAGPLAAWRAEQVVNATADEFPDLLSPRPTEADGIAAAQTLLRRMIWHLQLAGFQAARQRNPSGAISNDKMTIFIDGSWHGYDVFFDVGTPHQTLKVIFLEVFYADPQPDGGIPD
jgi:hypothetical protein